MDSNSLNCLGKLALSVKNKVSGQLPIIAFLTTAIFIYISSLNNIYAFKEHGPKMSGSNYAALNVPRDIKIEDDSESENLIYDSYLRHNQGNTHLQGNPVKITPWSGPKLVVIDPGHGGNDPGANSGSLMEKNINLSVSLKLNSLLLLKGIPTYMTRTDDSSVGLQKRIFTANEMNAALFISIHCNWFSDPTFNGVMTLYYPSKALYSGWLSELDYAYFIQRELSALKFTKDRGIIDRPDLAVLRHAQMPTVLVELGFLSNKTDAAILSSEDFQNNAAEALVRGIEKALNHDHP